MKVVLNGTENIEGMANAAVAAMKLREKHADSDLIGIRRSGQLYSVKFTRSSVIVHSNGDATDA